MVNRILIKMMGSLSKIGKTFCLLDQMVIIKNMYIQLRELMEWEVSV